MLKPTKTTWTVKRLVKEMNKGGVTFDNAVQRTLVWKKSQKALLIDSLLRGYPVPQMYANKSDKVFDMLDGKQRSNSIAEYIKGDFALTDDVQPLESETESKEEGESTELVIANCKFSDLPEEFQDRIYDATVDIIAYDDLSDEEISEIFKRLNNGKPLSAIELTRVKAKSLELIQEIGRHDIFTYALTAKALSHYANEDTVIKAYITLFAKAPSFETKVVRPLMESVEITDEQKTTIMNGFTKILEAYKTLRDMPIKDDAGNKKRNKICKRMLTRTHLLALMSLTPDKSITSKDLALFCTDFFSGSKTTKSEKYNSNASSGSARGEAVQTRIAEIKKAYAEYKNPNSQAETDAEIDYMFSDNKDGMFVGYPTDKPENKAQATAQE